MLDGCDHDAWLHGNKIYGSRPGHNEIHSPCKIASIKAKYNVGPNKNTNESLHAMSTTNITMPNQKSQT